MSARDIPGKGETDLGCAGESAVDSPLLARKSVLMGMLASGFVVANVAQASAATAGTVKPIAAIQPIYIPKWAPATAYPLGQQVVSPKNDVASANVAHTSSATYATDTAKWTPSSTYVSRAGGTSSVPAPLVAINVRDFGAVGDGVADDSAAFTAAYQVAVAASTNPFDGNRRGRVKIVIPAGTYLLTQAGAFMNATSGIRTYGIHWEGQGRGITDILWRPPAAGAFLLRNSDVWLGVHVSQMSFINQTKGASFLYSTSSGGAQDYCFQEVEWSGSPWAYGIALDGNNCNSEWKFDRCAFIGSWSGGFLASGIVPGQESQDQFLNFDFDSCTVVLSDGIFLNMLYGGGVRIRGGNFIALADPAQGQSALFFSMPNGDHFGGVQSFACEGVRFETRTPACKIIACSWKGGIVAFRSCDNSSYASIASTILATFTSLNNDCPAIVWDNCTLQGLHEYAYGVGSYARAPRICYRSCVLVDNAEAADFIVYTNTSGGINPGGTPPVHFEFCRGGVNGIDGWRHPFDCTVGWQTSSQGGGPTRKTFIFRTAAGESPRMQDTATPATVVLPKYAMPVALHIYKSQPTGTSGYTNWTYTLATTETTPTQLAQQRGSGTTAWATTEIRQTIAIAPFVCDTDAKRTLTLVADNIDQGSRSCYVAVEYLA
jgi:Pectate lyase superfamily protein